MRQFLLGLVKSLKLRRRPNSIRAWPPSRRPTLEGLEDRLALSTTSPSQLTVVTSHVAIAAPLPPAQPEVVMPAGQAASAVAFAGPRLVRHEFVLDYQDLRHMGIAVWLGTRHRLGGLGLN